MRNTGVGMHVLVFLMCQPFVSKQMDSFNAKMSLYHMIKKQSIEVCFRKCLFDFPGFYIC